MSDKIAEPAAVYNVEQLDVTKQADTSPNPVTAKPWQFQPGDPRINRKGRPKRGESSFDYTKKLVEKREHKKLVAEAKLERLLRTDSVGNRAWVDYRDTYYGIPKQTLVIQQGPDNLGELVAALQQVGLKQLPAPADITEDSAG